MIYFFQAEDGIRDLTVTGVQTCALPISKFHVEEPLTVGERVRHHANERLGGIRIPRPYSNSAASTRPWSSRRAATSRLSARRPRREAVGKRPSAGWPDRATTPCRIRRPG